MNSRVKALSQSRAILSEKAKSAEKDKARLLALVKHEILDEGVVAEALEKVGKMQAEAGGRLALMLLVARRRL